MYKLYFDKYCHVNNTSFNVITGASLCTYMVRMKKRKDESFRENCLNFSRCDAMCFEIINNWCLWEVFVFSFACLLHCVNILDWNIQAKSCIAHTSLDIIWCINQCNGNITLFSQSHLVLEYLCLHSVAWFNCYSKAGTYLFPLNGNVSTIY